MTWTIELSARARKALGKLPPDIRLRIVRALETLAANPAAAPNVKRLQERGDEMRLRVGDYRVLYALEHDRVVVYVIHVGRRREVYR